jgi:hypothetical protein
VPTRNRVKTSPEEGAVGVCGVRAANGAGVNADLGSPGKGQRERLDRLLGGVLGRLIRHRLPIRGTLAPCRR